MFATNITKTQLTTVTTEISIFRLTLVISYILATASTLTRLFRVVSKSVKFSILGVTLNIISCIPSILKGNIVGIVTNIDTGLSK